VRRYTVILDPDPESGVYTATVPALPGCISQGDTFEQAVARVREAILGHTKMLAKLGEAVPTEEAGLAVVAVSVDVEAEAEAEAAVA
jgi:predicted RNase H-like HicB family nuclease